MATKTRRPRGKPRRVVRLLAWDDEARAGVVLVRSGHRVGRFTLAFVEVSAAEPMLGWMLTCRCCTKVRRGEVIASSGAVECACARFERQGRCWHVAVIEQMRREGTLPACRPFPAEDQYAA